MKTLKDLRTFSDEIDGDEVVYLKDLKEWALECITEIQESSDYQIKKDAKINWIKEAFNLED